MVYSMRSRAFVPNPLNRVGLFFLRQVEAADERRRQARTSTLVRRPTFEDMDWVSSVPTLLEQIQLIDRGDDDLLRRG